MRYRKIGQDFHETSFLLVERISELGSHKQGLQEAVQVAGHSLVDQANVTWDNRKFSDCDEEVT